MKRREVTRARIVILLATISALAAGCYVRDRDPVVVHDGPRYDEHRYDRHEERHEERHEDHHDDHHEHHEDHDHHDDRPH